MAGVQPKLKKRSKGHGEPQSPVLTSQRYEATFLLANVITVVERCMSAMQTGTQMVKLRGSSKGLVRFYFLDEHKSCIRWRPSRKNEKAKISIDAIREVCEGKQSEIFQRYADGSFDPNCCFSIYYGDHMESLDLVSSNGEEARTWITGLKYLMAGISDEDSLAKRQRTRDQWLKQTFTEADKNGDGSLSISEVLQLIHKLNVNLPRQKVKQMFKEADTDDNQGTLGFEEFCAFYKMMSTRRDLYLLMLTYSNHKDHLDTDDLIRFLEIEQKMLNVTKEHCLEIVEKFEPCPENRKQGVLGIDGFTNYMRSPAGDIFNPEHHQVHQDMRQPLCNYFIASSHNTYLMGDQLMSQSRADMYSWVLQAGCRCVEVDCWDGPDGEPIVHHGYTLTSKILFKDVIETINKYAFIKNDYPVIISLENHCSVPQQKKMAQYLIDVLGDKLDLSSVNMDESGQLPPPEHLRGKILVKGKKLPPNIDENAEEGEVSDEDSADEIEDDCKLMNGDISAKLANVNHTCFLLQPDKPNMLNEQTMVLYTSINRKQVENVAKKKLDTLMKESKIRDCEDPDSFTITALPSSGKLNEKVALTKQKSSPSAGDKRVGKVEDDAELGEKDNLNKRQSRSFMGNFSKRKKKTVKLKKSSSFEDEEDELETSVSASRGAAHYSRMSRQKKTMKLSRALSDLVKYTKSVGVQDIETQVFSSWQVSSLSETKAHQIMQQKPTQFIHFNQRQLSRIYPSSYRVDSSNYNPQPFWNAGCHLVALNYQSEGRVLQLNRAKFNSNGNCGYVLKPKCMCEGAFNPMSEDPLPGQMKKQLVLKIISGQQLPKPKDSMLGDRGEIIDPFVEVEIIGLPADCCKEQTRVVDDNGFNPMWEETLVFTMHMPEIALVRFLVWDHDPIGRDFIGQRTIAFSSMMPGYRHVYLEGMEEASIFVHVAVNDITGKVRQAIGIKGLFHRNPKQASLDSHAAAQLSRKHPFGAHLLRRTASAPTKGQQKVKKGFPEISIDNKEYSSEGASEDRESEDACQPRVDCETDSGARVATVAIADSANGELHSESFKDKETSFPPSSASHLHTLETITEEAHNAEDNSAVQIPSAHVASGPSLSGYSETLAVECIGPSQLDQVSDDVCQRSPLCKEHDTVMEGATESLRTTEGITNLEITNSPSNLTPSLSNTFHAGSEEVNSAISVTGQVNGQNPETNNLNAWQVKKNKQEEENNNGKHPMNAISVNLPVDLSAKVLVTKVPEGSQAASSKAHVLVRRSKSEGYVRLANPENSQWMVPEVCTDVTLNDRLWSKLENHRDSVSSSSSISSSDTVIDLSLPNLAHKSLTDLNTSRDESLEVFLKNEVARPRSATTGCEISRVTKSKSNPNLRVEEDLEAPHNLQTRPLVKEPVQAMQRRHTWSRLFVESLKQTSQSKKPASSVSLEVDGPSKSKSLGDLTSDDIMCNFESKYRSISRSFITRSMRDQRKPPKKSHDNLTEQIKQLTAVEPLTASDFASSSLNATEQEDETFCFLRRSSSRSQSRVRYIANRAKQAQERQRLQGLSRMSSSPIEERGNPEGACCMSKGTCADLDLLSQLPAAPPVRQLSDIEAEVFFMLKL
ncbi:1-phosphatidylinositol 4,5-bisphosphate phosphodiesterase eta-2a isoform X3 [Polypterus senegalus]|uniref:1-phosphatidylinositol 4,5-bisphosphate phosphodiesterase eta-2a isoform X3 n=1 Tax=Polypterus senegalus TaxID=55291 RepID=UPI001964B1B1|nr:1-phosphatidylinositol 4,5-bisphosphate phosphodiesterase eta-2a isoform X3 [Polypterus senegalus]XP_039611991.1 1-phosphatidylinositol 4,5-bisphosphate phosphodiesterase eta-2a isoform X3 [Polypterus senegalus]XP_039611992.1 1-phosphatidylinositol 4,5-bisphosphate phosphodiesterase eta-2a isoform X3 [Polypterus senegalus]XP_039611993.1 1-phosphatidylinositol 4,5-bisphosphate phosphodiesterase eta-2a isoform X3 [Polypterus senegalus]